jgi:hypothetical protein
MMVQKYSLLGLEVERGARPEVGLVYPTSTEA